MHKPRIPCTWQSSSIHFRHGTSLLRLHGHFGPVYLTVVTVPLFKISIPIPIPKMSKTVKTFSSAIYFFTRNSDDISNSHVFLSANVVDFYRKFRLGFWECHKDCPKVLWLSQNIWALLCIKLLACGVKKNSCNGTKYPSKSPTSRTKKTPSANWLSRSSTSKLILFKCLLAKVISDFLT